MKLWPLRGKAKAAARLSTARINCYEGSVRSGKTIGTLIEWFEFCVHGPEGTFLMAGRTERTVINNLVLPLQEMFGPERVVINRGTGAVNIGGRDVIIVGANNEAARTKIQGLTLAGAYADEVSTLPESFFNMLTSRLSVKGARMWTTCNPEGPGHWFKKKWLDRATLWVRGDGTIVRKNPDAYDADDPERPINLHRFSFTLDDNAHNLDAEYVANTKAMYSGLWYRRMILGEWTVADGAVYDMFDTGAHVLPHDQFPAMERILGVALDYGTTNPTAGVLLGLGVDGRLYVIDEFAPKRGGTDADISLQLAAWMEDHPPVPYVFVDPSAKSLKTQLHRDGIRPADADNSVLDGIRTVASLFRNRQLVIASRCTHLLDELPGYVWDAKASEKGEDKVVKVDDHHLDAFRYIVKSTYGLWFRRLAPPPDQHANAA